MEGGDINRHRLPSAGRSDEAGPMAAGLEGSSRSTGRDGPGCSDCPQLARYPQLTWYRWHCPSADLQHERHRRLAQSFIGVTGHSAVGA